MKITIITPSFNQAQYIHQTLESIHGQQGDFELEHMVIDGGSNDETVEILEQWKDRLWFVSEQDNGQSHALNKGLARATGDVIGWINSDDYLLPGAMHHVSEFFKHNPETNWAYGKCLSVDQHGFENRKGIYGIKNLMMRKYSYGKLLLANFISQPATFFRRNLYEQAGGINENLHFAMDYDLWLRFGVLGDPGVINEELAAFRFYSDCKTGGRKMESLREANQLSKMYAEKIDKAWLGDLNYYLYYKFNGLVNKMAGLG